MATAPARFGWVLAGGASSRMGTDKAKLPWGDTDVLGHAVAVLSRSGVGRVLVSGRPGHSDAIPDDEPNLGPLGGLVTLARHCPDGAAWIIAVDAPQVSPADLHALAADGTQQACCFEGFPMPMWLRLDAHARATLAAASRHPEAARRSLRA